MELIGSLGIISLQIRELKTSDNESNWRLHMRHIILLVSVLLLGLSWALAQTTASQTSPSTSSGQSSNTSAGGEKTVQGCLSGSNGSYTLTDKHGTSYELTGDTAKLSEHVGHEVRITGTSNSASSSPSGASGTTGSTASQHTLEVTSLKHISKTCQAGGGMSH